MVSPYWPVATIGPRKIVGTWLLCELSSSSQVTMSRLLLFLAHWTYASMLFLSQVSPCWIVPSCMSFCRFGTTIDTVGSWEQFEGKEPAKGMLSAAGTSVKSTQRLCLRAQVPRLAP